MNQACREMNKGNCIFLFLVFAILIANTSCSNNQNNNQLKKKQESFNGEFVDSLDLAMNAEFDKGHLPGFAISVFTKDSIHYMKGYGYSDIARKKLYSENTIQSVASISKTLIGIALMKAEAKGLLSLDDPINNILSFEVTNPKHKNIPITLRHLATHTSSISDDGNYKKAYVFSEELEFKDFPEAWNEHIKQYNQNESLEMKDFLKKVFHDWSTDENFLAEVPGSKVEYSNLGAALLAYCIELKLGKDYRTITYDWIINPLRMKSSGWDISKLDQSKEITYYNENLIAVPRYEVITYPDGGLYSSVYDMTLYMQEMIAGFQGDGNILSTDSYAEMMKNQIPNLDVATGIIWDLDVSCCIGHGGNDFGVATLAYFDKASGIGKVLFSNLSIEEEASADQFYSIFNALFRFDKMIEKSEIDLVE